MTRDFGDDMRELLGAADAARARSAQDPTIPSLGEALAHVLDGVQLPDGAEVDRRALGHPCERCRHLVEEAERRGLPVPPVAEAELRINPDTGRFYWLGTCASCTDVEFSKRWNARKKVALEGKDAGLIARIEREGARWVARGRKLYA